MIGVKIIKTISAWIKKIKLRIKRKHLYNNRLINNMINITNCPRNLIGLKKYLKLAGDFLFVVNN